MQAVDQYTGLPVVEVLGSAPVGTRVIHNNVIFERQANNVWAPIYVLTTDGLSTSGEGAQAQVDAWHAINAALRDGTAFGTQPGGLTIAGRLIPWWAVAAAALVLVLLLRRGG